MAKKTEDIVEERLYPEGTRVPETGRYFNAGPGWGVHGCLRRFEAGERFPVSAVTLFDGDWVTHCEGRWREPQRL